MQGTAEEQFAAITAAARAEALREIDNLLSDDESVDYSPPEQQPLEPQVQVRNNGQQISDSDETNNSTPESATDSSLDTSSIEVIQPQEGLEIRLPINPPQRAPPEFFKFYSTRDSPTRRIILLQEALNSFTHSCSTYLCIFKIFQGIPDILQGSILIQHSSIRMHILPSAGFQKTPQSTS